MESKGLCVNIKKTKVMCSQSIKVPLNKCGRHPCSVCWKGVGCNSIRCTGPIKSVPTSKEIYLL